MNTQHKSPATRLAELGVTLPPPSLAHDRWVFPHEPAPISRIAQRIVFSEYGPLDACCTFVHPSGRFGETLDAAQGAEIARQTMIAILADLDCLLPGGGGAIPGHNLRLVKEWPRISIVLATTPNFLDHHAVADGLSKLLTDVFGQTASVHGREVIGVASLPFGRAMQISGEVRYEL